jgi:hypothetical protein
MRLLLLLPLLCASLLQAQPSSLPLQEGNHWVYDYVLRDQRTAAASRVEVHGQVRVPSLEKDQVFSTKAGWNALFGDTGTAYFKLFLDGGLAVLFPTRQPDTLLVRADEAGNIWIRGFTFPRFRTVVKARDQLWLKAQVGPPYYWEIEVGDFILPEYMAYYQQEEWRYRDRDGQERALGFAQRRPEFEAHPVDDIFPERYLAFARRFLPELTATSPQRLLLLDGTLRNASHGSFSVVLLTGIGPIWIPIHTDQTELQGARLELAEARIDGQVWKPRAETVVLMQSWAQVKAGQASSSLLPSSP